MKNRRTKNNCILGGIMARVEPPPTPLINMEPEERKKDSYYTKVNILRNSSSAIYGNYPFSITTYLW